MDMRNDTGPRAHLDLGSSYARELSEGRFYRAGWRDTDKDTRATGLEPSKRYRKYVPEPHAVASMSEMMCCTRWCHSAASKSTSQRLQRIPVNILKWTPEGRWLLTGTSTGEVTLWSGYNFEYNRVIACHEHSMTAMTWSRSGDWMVSGDEKGIIKVSNTSIRHMADLEGHTQSVRGLCFSPMDLKLASCSDDITIKIWDFATRKEELTLKGHGFDVKALDWHLSKGLIVSASRDNTCKLWSPREGKCVRTITGHTQPVNAVSFHPTNEDLFFSASKDCTVRVHDLRMLKEGVPETCILQWKANDSEIKAAKWHPIVPDLIATGASDGSLAFWTIAGDQTLPIRQAFVPAAHEKAIHDMDWNPLGHVLTTGGKDCTSKFWARPRPGDSEAELYRGYSRNVSEADKLREAGVALPMNHEEREIDRNTRTTDHLRKQLAATVLPGIGLVGEEFAYQQAGILLPLPQDNATLAAVAVEAVVNEQRRLQIEGEDESARTLRRPPLGAGGFTGGPSRGVGGGPNQQQLQREKEFREIQAVEDFPKPRFRGSVRKWDEKGFGYITPFDPSFRGESIYAHVSNIAPGMGSNAGEGPDSLVTGTIVEFSVVEAENRKNNQMQKRAVYIIDKQFFQPGFQGADEGQQHQHYAPGNNNGNNYRGPPPATSYQQVPQPQQPHISPSGYGAPPSAVAPPAAPPGQQFNPEFLAQVRAYYEAGQVEYLNAQLPSMGLTLQDILPMIYPSYGNQ